MRRRIIGVAVLAVLLAVTLLGVPLAIAGRALLYSDERNELERLALRGAAAVSADAAAGDPVELPQSEQSVRVGIYDRRGVRIAGTGPPRADLAVRRALAGRVSDRTTRDQVIAAVPVSSGERVVAVARAAAARSAVDGRVARAWGGMLALGLLAIACALVVAVGAARRVIRPLDHLVAMARDLGDGTFHLTSRPSGVPELDRASAALIGTSGQLEALVSRERAFSAHASHQLRTPLTALRLGLDTALETPGADLEQAARVAVAAADELSRTIDDVLALARGGPVVTSVNLAAVLADVRARWHGALAAQGRPLRTPDLDLDGATTAAGSPAAVRQALDVLLDNASVHGSGVVTMAVRVTDSAVAIDVSDEGSTTGQQLVPVTGGDAAVDVSATRLGLFLARSLAESQGGRLLHARTEERTRFTILLPGASAES